MSIDTQTLSRAATEARGLALDAVHKCSSGHLGLPLGCAEIGAVLFGQSLRYNPEDADWLNRDRFILSAGHGSMFLYSWLHLAGYPRMTLDEVKNFRVLGSQTPGHPEQFETPGVEATTGPLGQGIGNSVGYAVSQKMAAARFNTAEHTIFDSHIICLAGDGCMQEGIAHEASALAGHLRLDNLILIYDSNDVTLDAMAKASQSEDTAKRFEAYGWDVQTVDGHDLAAVFQAVEAAKAASGKPQLIIAKTIIGRGIAEVEGTAKAHGEGGAKFTDEAHRQMGLPEEYFYVSDETKAYFAAHKTQLAAAYDEWQQTYSAWRETNPELAALLDSALSGDVPGDLLASVPEFPADTKIATRKAAADVLQPLAAALPLLISGSADLHGSTLNYIKSDTDFSAENYAARNIRYGIREHAMAAISNGIAYDGIFRPSCATFLVFADYARPSIRLAALSGLPVIYIFTHDSVGVGEDGPTHQPVETVTGLRVMPNLDVIRPADPEETAGAFVAALEQTEGPTLLALSRQALPTLNEIPVKTRRNGVRLGGYIALKETAALDTILMSAGSELQHALAAAKELGPGTRVVSLPCHERFLRQPAAYQEEVLPSACRQRVAIEAGVRDAWDKFVGLDGKLVCLDRFGLSAPGSQVMEVLGLTAGAVVEAAQSLSK